MIQGADNNDCPEKSEVVDMSGVIAAIREQIDQAGEIAEDDPAGCVLNYRKLVAERASRCNEELMKLDELPVCYKVKAARIIGEWIKKWEERFRKSSIYSLSFKGALKAKVPDLSFLKTFYEGITDVRKNKLKGICSAAISNISLDMDDIEEGFLSEDGNEKEHWEDLNYRGNDIAFLQQHPGLDEFVMAETGAVPRIGILELFLKYMESYRDKRELLDHTEQCRKMWDKYGGGGWNYEGFLRAADKFNEARSKLKSVDLQDMYDFLRSEIIDNLRRIDEFRDLKAHVDRLIRFDEEIAPLLNDLQRGEIVSVFSKERDLSNADFKKRVDGYLKVFKYFEDELGEGFDENALVSLDNFLVEEVIEHGGNADEIQSQVLKNWEEVKKTARITINAHRSSLPGIYKDGEIKTYQEMGLIRREKGIAGRTHYGEFREKSDQRIAGGKSFIVGALSSRNGCDEYVGAAPFYGHGVIELAEDRVRDRVSFFEGDSLTAKSVIAKVMPNWLLRKWDNPDSRRLGFDGAKFVKALMDVYARRHGFTHIHNMYMEAHVAAPVTVSDFSRVTYALFKTKDGVADDAKLSELRQIADELLGINPSAPPLEIIKADFDFEPKEHLWRSGMCRDQMTNDKLF